jgi:hypothetical protein
MQTFCFKQAQTACFGLAVQYSLNAFLYVSPPVILSKYFSVVLLIGYVVVQFIPSLLDIVASELLVSFLCHKIVLLMLLFDLTKTSK